jgi:transposase
MDAIETLKQDVREGRVSPERLVDLIVSLQRQLQTANRRIAELEKKLSGPPTAKVDEPFSMRAEEKRQQARGKNKHQKKPKVRRGRLKSADKIKLAERTEQVYPKDVPPEACQLSHVRPVWRLENNRAVLIAYEIYRGPNNQYGKIPGVLDRGEFGSEIVVQIAHLVYVVGLSFDKVCQILQFFQHLHFPRSS